MSAGGRIAYALWHAPVASIRRSAREGGPWQQAVTRGGRKQMERAALGLPPLAPPGPGAAELGFLTGRRFWFQTAFCAWSLARHSGTSISFVFHDDGTLDQRAVQEARRIFPACRIVSAAEAEARLDRALPVSRFPALRSQRRTYLHLRKLTDFHAGREGWRAVLDSDMLFFRRPAALLDWLARPDRPIHMIDVHNAYGYSEGALSSLAGQPICDRVNVGICGLRSDHLDWERIESRCAALLRHYGTSYYLEQALIALILTGTPCLRLPAPDYRLMPDIAECRQPTAVMHHYVDLSKRGYFRHAWKQIPTGGLP